MTKRLFVAINFDQTTQLALGKLLIQLPHQPGFNKTKLDNLHLTLQFLGDTDENLIPAIQDTISEVTKLCPPFALIFTGLGAFPNWNQPNLIWLGVAGDHLLALQDKLAQKLITLVPTMDTKPFKPHLTLVRIKSPLNQSVLNGIQTIKNSLLLPTPAQITHIDLMSSTLTPQGSIYTVLSSHDLIDKYF